MKILLVEDDEMIGESIQIVLESENLSVDWVKDGMQAEAAIASRPYDAMLLDLGLPYRDGVDILRKLRAEGNAMPVLVLTARDTVAEKVHGLRSGADDYLVKPFDLDELIARLEALMRRVRGGFERVYRNGDVVVHIDTREVQLAGRQVMLSAREWEILEALVLRPGAILSVHGLTSDALAAGAGYVPERLLTERSISVNTAAAGGNASLMTIG